MSTVTEQTIFKLRERILDGKYPPGAHLGESELAQDLNVSRNPVQAALRVLAGEDLLYYYPNRGYVVREVDIRDVLDAYDVRGSLEGVVCRIIAERGLVSTEQVKLAGILERGEKLFASRKWGSEQQAAWRSVNTEFHETLAEMSTNRHLGALLKQIRRFPRMFDARLDPESEFFQRVYTREQRQRSHREHLQIYDALYQRQGTRAENLMREHVYVNREVLRRSLAPTSEAEKKAAQAEFA